MSILITLLIYLVIFGLIWYCVGLLPLPEPIRTIVNVVFVILCIVVLLGLLTGTGVPSFRL